MKKLEIYKCDVCENVIEILDASFGTIECCAQVMQKMEEKSASDDDAHFAHVEHLGNQMHKVYFNHPMTKEHHIKYIEAISKDSKYVKRKFLEIDETPELVFNCKCEDGFIIRIYCNIHGVYAQDE